jgi:hypothetical protein
MFDQIMIEIVAGTRRDNGLDPEDENYKAWVDVAASRRSELSKSDMENVSDYVRQMLHRELDNALDEMNSSLQGQKED